MKKMEPMTTLHEKAWNRLICYYQPGFFGHPFINWHVQFFKEKLRFLPNDPIIHFKEAQLSI